MEWSHLLARKQSGQLQSLHAFLTQAGLSGGRLELAIRACDNNPIETVEDLRLLEDDLEDIIPQRLISKKIQTALKKVFE